jgi:hypothetical protein
MSDNKISYAYQTCGRRLERSAYTGLYRAQISQNPVVHCGLKVRCVIRKTWQDAPTFVRLNKWIIMVVSKNIPETRKQQCQNVYAITHGYPLYKGA